MTGAARASRQWATEVRRTLRLGGPLVLAQLGQMSMSLVDTLMVSRLGETQLAAAALGNAVFFPIVITSLGVLAAVGPLVAQAFGGGRTGEIGRALRHGLWLALLLALPAVVLLWNVTPLLRMLGQSERVIPAAAAYLEAISTGLPPLLCFGVLRYLVEALSRPRIVMLITLAAALLNVPANYVLMYGKAGFPALGLTGCGWASAFVYGCMLASILAYVLTRRDLAGYRLFADLARPRLEALGEVFRLGWPIGITQGMEMGYFALSTVLMGLLGTAAQAAHQVAITSAAFAYMVPLGLSLAVAVRTGQAAGRGDGPGVRRAGYAGIGLGLLFMSASGAAFWFFPRQIIGLFLNWDDPASSAAAGQAVVLLRIAAFFQVFDGLQVSAAGALRGLKDTRTPMLISLLSYWLIGLGGGAVLAFGYGWGGAGIWLGFVAGLGSAAVLLLWRFQRIAPDSG